MSQKRQPEESDGPRRGGGADPGGSSSSLPQRPGETKRQRVPALRDVISEVMCKITIEKVFMAIEPLIRRVVKEEIELAFANHTTMMARSVTETVPCTSKKLQLQFMSRLSLPIFTGSKIEGEGSLSITIALVDAFTGQVVASGKESLMRVEIVVLEGDFEAGEDWTAQDFENNIIKEREGKRPLISGDVLVSLTGGIGTVGELSLTDNSSWTRSRKFRLGARTEDGSFNGIRVREAKSESFVVKDHRGELYKKHHPPSLEDEVWRLEKIGKDGAFHKRLNKESIITVKNFLTLLHLDAPKLRKILGGGMSTKMWWVTVDHAKTCVLSDKVHYYFPNNTNKTGVVFNVVGEVRGVISDKFVLVDDLSETEKTEARAAVKQAYEDWKNVFTCDNETLLRNSSHLFNIRSPSLHENQYEQVSTQAGTDGFSLSDSTIPSADIFSMEPSSSLDPCALETEESDENRLHSELLALEARQESQMFDPCALDAEESDENRFESIALEARPESQMLNSELITLGDREASQESEMLAKFSNSLVYDESTNHPSFGESYYSCVDPGISFDTQDLGAALKGFIATISKPKPYRGWRMLSYVLGLIFYTKKIVALKRKKHVK